MALEALLFDMDGTLIDSEPLWQRCENQIMAGWGATWTPQLGAAMTGKPLRTTAAMMLRAAGIFRDEGEVVAALVGAMCAAYRGGEVPWMPGARALLRQAAARSIRCAIVSSSYRVLVDAVADTAPAATVGVSVAGDEVARPKPAPEPYLRAAELLGVPISACAVVEDSASGVRAGLAAGAVTVAVGEHPGLAEVAAHARFCGVGALDLRRIDALVAAQTKTGQEG